jgi:hypothetical protein
MLHFAELSWVAARALPRVLMMECAIARERLPSAASGGKSPLATISLEDRRDRNGVGYATVLK